MALFPPRREALVNYDWVDYLSKRGYISFYGGTVGVTHTKYESFTSANEASSLNLEDSNWVAQTFTIGNTGVDEDFYVTKVRVVRGGTANTGVFLDIQKTTAGKPNGVTVMRWEQSSQATIPKETESSTDWREFDLRNADFWNGEKLEAGTMYALVLWATTSDPDATLIIDTSGTYAGGTLWETTNSGGDWTDQEEDAHFEVWGSTVNPYILSTEQFNSNWDTTTFELETATSQGTEDLTATLIFDMTVNKTDILDGTAFIDTSISSNADCTEPSAELYIVRNGAETLLGKCDGWMNYDNLQGQIPLTRTRIKRGEILRLKIVVGIKEDDTEDQADVTFNHNPQTPTLKLDLPFKLDI